MMGRRKTSQTVPRQLIDRFFREEKNPYSKRKPLKISRIVGLLSVALGALIVVLLVTGGQTSHSSAKGADHPDFQIHTGEHASPVNQGVSLDPASKSGSMGSTHSMGGSGGMMGTGGTRSQTHAANQVIRRGAGGNDPGAALPMGQGIPVRLLNSILSTDSTTPIIAEVTDDIEVHGILSIPQGTHAIGSAQYDDTSHRIQIRFHTLVYPEGGEHGIQAMGMMPDGSAGLEGDYHSGGATRQVGRFIGYFVSGMADGMENRQQSGPFGTTYAPGSLQNGVLNGVSLSAQDQAKSLSDGLGNVKPTMTLPSGQTFILFLEHEYMP